MIIKEMVHTHNMENNGNDLVGRSGWGARGNERRDKRGVRKGRGLASPASSPSSWG